ncbi:MAG TPA: hypothetical protein VHC18_23050 [Amycolatopsis sp.]|nr:hypothetical protein [Amycolatopsis sp.]
MNEQELGRALRAAVLDEPPLTIDPDRLIARAKRETHRRWAVATTGVAVVAIAAAAVIFAQRKQGGGADPVAAAPAPPAATVTVTVSGMPAPSRREAELVEYEKRHLPQVLKGVRIESVTGSGAREGDPILGVRVAVAGHPNPLELVVTSKDHSESVDTFCAHSNCYERQTLPDGSTTLFTNPGGSFLIAAHFRTDGSIIEVNRWREDAKPWPEIPEAVFLQLATDPNLSF